MTISLKQIILSIALVGVVFALYGFVTNTNVFVDTAAAFGESGDGGCCGGGAEGAGGAGDGGAAGAATGGCTDRSAINYFSGADYDNGSCVYPVPTTCVLTASANTVAFGGSVTLSWNTQGFTNIAINGEAVSGTSGSRTFSNIEVNTVYRLTATNANGDTCNTAVSVTCLPPVVVPPKCESFTANPTTITVGESSLLTWDTTNATRVAINNGIGDVAADGSISVSPLVTTTYLLTVFGTDSQKAYCEQQVTVVPKEVTECELTLSKSVDKTTALIGDELTYTISIKNTGTADCTGGGVKIYDVVDGRVQYQSHTLTSNLTAGYEGTPVYTASDRTLRFNGNTLTPGESGEIIWKGVVTAPASCGDFVVKNQAKATAKELSNFSVWAYSNIVETTIDNDCTVLHPSCDSFTAAPTIITVGESSLLTWDTTNATRVAINNGIGEVAVDGSISVSPLTTTVYLLTVFGTDDKKAYCEATVTVSEDEVPVCEAFTATPSTLPIGGGSVVLDWVVTGATGVSIAPTVGSVALVGTTSVSITESTTYTLTATDADGDEVSCIAPVAVPDPEPVFTCADNVVFTASDTSIDEGDSSTLSWNVTGADSVSISNISATSFSGTQTVSPTSDTTYVLTATKSGFDSIACPVSIDVSTGGGGGGSATPRCELTISKTKITRGEEITLTWDTRSIRELILTDDRGNVIVTTEDKLSDDKEDLFDSEITLTPTRDTEYTLRVERGSRDRECKVSVEMDDDIVLLQTRDQAPLVAGISLTEVPYTGFEAGPVMTVLFYALLVAWALYITYVLVIPKSMLTAASVAAAPRNTADLMAQAETVRPDVFAAMPTASVTTAPTAAAPANLPVATMETAAPVAAEVEDTSVATEVENEAHLHQALLSSGAVQSLIAMTTESNRSEMLTKVIADAKGAYPLEDGWVVINQTRLTELTAQAATPAVGVTGNGSLAEAIVTGNVVAAYDMIGARPMFALADAAADLDTLYRNRKGANESVSDLLTTATADMTDAQIADMIAALTGALDGTYTDEASAVKMAIMKAIKVAA